MCHYAINEETDMHFVCGADEENAAEVQTLYKKYFPTRRMLDLNASQRHLWVRMKRLVCDNSVNVESVTHGKGDSEILIKILRSDRKNLNKQIKKSKQAIFQRRVGQE
ncbi:hypothetical protein CDAR_259751 [Caerostris darwini]|uniref:DUF4817 domain-containing protein n=1 Tax=Caerostris darwini TaxID=1538125 RepID=A0AAV4VN76_9ARAC|nr:hypothetical protein CDAR_259751 [Caerostris darwini]